MPVIIATRPDVEIAGKMRFRYTCTRCGRKWDGTPPTFEEGRVCVVTLVFCSEGCANENIQENTVIHTKNLQ